MPSLNKLDQDTLMREIAQLKSRVSRLNAILSGQQIGGVRIRDLAVTDAKIVSLSADKITTGTLQVGEYIYVGTTIIIGTPP